MREGLSRRSVLQRSAAVGALAAAGGLRSRSARSQAVPKVAPITMVINQSPWFDGFRQLVEKYQSETGNTITLDVNPYAGALAKIRNSLRAAPGTYDLLAIDNNWMVEMFDGGFIMPLDELEAGFKLDPNISTYDGTIFWNANMRTFDPKGGALMGCPINGNVDVLFYRKDLYEAKGLKFPETWEELEANVKALNNPPHVYGLVHRDGRTSIWADYVNYMFSSRGSLFANPKDGDFTITVNSPANLKALEFYLNVGKAGGYRSPGSVEQGPLIGLVASGKAAHSIIVIGAWAQLEDPTKSVVIGKIDAGLMPRSADGQHAARAGHWIGAIARNVPKDRQLAALEFIKWFGTLEHQLDYTRFGAVPVRVDVADSDLANEPKYRFLKAQVANSRVARMYAVVPEAAQLNDILSLGLNECVLGKTKPADALNKAAAECYEIIKRGGHKTGQLPML